MFLKPVDPPEPPPGQSESDDDGEEFDVVKWLRTYFPGVATKPLAPHHFEFWEWIVSLRRDIPSPGARIFPWFRGAGKSSSVHLGIAYLASRKVPPRRFFLVVCATQDQANLHVEEIGACLQALGIGPRIGIYGTQRTWNRRMLKTNTGVTILGIGLDKGVRGLNSDALRPDFLCLDDIDDSADSLKEIRSKENRLLGGLFGALASDPTILFVQNVIHKDSIMNKVLTNEAAYLNDATFSEPVPAIRNFTYKATNTGNGRRKYKAYGEPSWPQGFSLKSAENILNAQGLAFFNREYQHEVSSVSTYFFKVDEIKRVFRKDAGYVPLQIVEDVEEPEEMFMPSVRRLSRSWDMAGTQRGGDYTVGWLTAEMNDGSFLVMDVIRAQLASHNVQKLIRLTCEWDLAMWGRRVRPHFPEDPAQAGKFQAEEMRKRFRAFRPVITSVSGDKAVRARTMAKEINEGNVGFLEDGYPRDNGPLDDFIAAMYKENGLDGGEFYWHLDAKKELKDFREDEDGLDDQVDAGADSFQQLVGAPSGMKNAGTPQVHRTVSTTLTVVGPGITRRRSFPGFDRVLSG